MINMVLKPDQERVRTLLQDTITLLCRNGLNFKTEFNINALIGITLDKDDVFLVDIKETIKNAPSKDDDSDEENNGNTDSMPSSPSRKRRKHRRKESYSAASDAESITSEGQDMQGTSQIKAETDDNSNDDAIIIKDEPAYDTNNYGQNQTDILGSLSQHGQLYAAPTSEALGTSWDQSSQALFSQSPSQPPNIPMSSQLQQQQQETSTSSTCSYVKIRDPTNVSSILFQCSYCQHTTKSSVGMYYHLNEHRGIYPYYCPYCSKGEKATTNLRSHLKTKHGVWPTLHCLKCGLTLEKVVDYVKHVNQCTGMAMLPMLPLPNLSK